MPNGYDGLLSQVRYIFDFLDYCEALVAAEEKLFSHLGDLRVTTPLRPRMIAVLDETEAITKYLEETIYPAIRQGIVDHNRDMGEVFRVHLAEAMRKEGTPDAQVNAQVKGSIERTMIDYEGMDAQFSSITSALSSLKSQVRAFSD